MSRQDHVLVVGGGSIGERHVRCFLQTGRARVSLCELHDARREFVAATYPLEASYSDWSAALADRPDVVVVATPAHLHLAMARDAILHGAAVLIENPYRQPAKEFRNCNRPQTQPNCLFRWPTSIAVIPL